MPRCPKPGHTLMSEHVLTYSKLLTGSLTGILRYPYGSLRNCSDSSTYKKSLVALVNTLLVTGGNTLLVTSANVLLVSGGGILLVTGSLHHLGA